VGARKVKTSLWCRRSSAPTPCTRYTCVNSGPRPYERPVLVMSNSGHVSTRQSGLAGLSGRKQEATPVVSHAAVAARAWALSGGFSNTTICRMSRLKRKPGRKGGSRASSRQVTTSGASPGKSRPEWQRPVGIVAVSVGIGVVVANFLDRIGLDFAVLPGGHNTLYFLGGLTLAGVGVWWLGLLD